MSTILTYLYQFNQRDYFVIIYLAILIPISLLIISRIFNIDFIKRDFYISLINLLFPILFILFGLIMYLVFNSGKTYTNNMLLQTGLFFLALINIYHLLSNTIKWKLIFFSILILFPLTPIIFFNDFSLFSLISFTASLLITTALIAFLSKRDEYND